LPKNNYILLGSLSLLLYDISLHHQVNGLNSLILSKKFSFNHIDSEILKYLIEQFPDVLDSTLILNGIHKFSEKRKSESIKLKIQTTRTLKSSSSIIVPNRNTLNSPHTPTRISVNISPRPNTPNTPVTPRRSDSSSSTVTSNMVTCEFKRSTIKFKEMWNQESFILKMNEEEFTDFIFDMIQYFVVHDIISNRFYYFKLYYSCFVGM
jgi:hypothetical protein